MAKLMFFRFLLLIIAKKINFATNKKRYRTSYLIKKLKVINLRYKNEKRIGNRRYGSDRL